MFITLHTYRGNVERCRFMRFQSRETARFAVSARDPRAISRSRSHGSMTVNFAAIFETKRSRSTAASAEKHLYTQLVKDRGAPLHSHYALRVRNARDGRERVNAAHRHACPIPGSARSANSIVGQCPFTSKSRSSWHATAARSSRLENRSIYIVNYCESSEPLHLTPRRNAVISQSVSQI